MLLRRARFTQDLDAVDRQLATQASELRGMNDRFAALQAEYEEQARQLQRRTEEYNDEVRLWTQRGGAPPLVMQELQQQERALRIERESLEGTERGLLQRYERIRVETERLNLAIEDRNRQADASRSESPASVSESGRYDESVQTRNGEVVSVERKIRVFRFADRAELVFVIAHELGHALGLGHATARGALMSEVVSTAGDLAVSGIGRSDVEMLRSRCPEL